MRGVYAEAVYRLHRPGETGAAHLSLEGAEAAGLHSARRRCGPAADVDVGPSEDVITCLLLSGSLSTATPGRELRPVRPGEVFTCATGSGMHGVYGEGATFGMLRLPRRAVLEAAQAAGLAEGVPLRVLSTDPLDGAAGQYWRQLMAFTHRQLTAPGSPMGHPLYADHWQQSLAAAVLRVFPNTTLTTDAGYLPGPGVTGPATVRRALAYAEAHAAEPIGIGDLARAAGIGVRALQLAYAQHVGCSPMAHLRQLRLGRAHVELVAASPRAGDGSGTTVAAVAARWGFTPGGFTNAYRAKYGQSPRVTLRS